MTKLAVVRPTAHDFPALTELWEASVRATHHFLLESDLQFFKPLIQNQYLGMVELVALQEPTGKFHGFLGVLNGKIEMLFIDPESRGQGCGKQLLLLALEEWKATELDVNEQNEQAVGFYRKMGFEVIGRSPVDGMGKPYPLLHLVYRGG
ncbi:GNAT family N-acetyltransferase [Flavihumibacter sp. CACIAM 22H1]|uniref:GNAT family N-acetyltransferase n=1 Tax=Flavihumibacter sp. CACIAM 22H1 TaxID=1812911 RepID=UPI0007A8A6F8|nr:GNAT family N-acetyltransferase [Flavihumibacter sp. CACIAM 22H1]KYP13202.1 MAG: GCN5 family acetyltransferase [Flavihumibacter sp. CACIAM 22H1]